MRKICNANWVFAILFLLLSNQSLAGWQQKQKLFPSAPQYWGKFGVSVAIDGNTAVIGAEGVEYASEESVLHIYSHMMQTTGRSKPNSCPAIRLTTIRSETV